MSTDLEMDLFSRDLFTALWRTHGLWTEAPTTTGPQSRFDEDILKAVQCRRAFFHSTYLKLFENLEGELEGKSNRFFDAIVTYFPHPWKDDMAMSLFLSSCAFVADLTMWCKSKGEDFLDVAHKAWAMFVDLHLQDAFYLSGGWKDLRIYAAKDQPVYEYVRTFSDLVHCKLGKNVLRHATHLTIAALESFRRFEVWPDASGDDVPLALKWVDFCVREPARKFRPPSFFKMAEASVFEELELAVFHLGKICCPYNPKEDDADDTNEELEKPDGGPDSVSCNREFVSGSNEVGSHDPDGDSSEKSLNGVRDAEDETSSVEGDPEEETESRNAMMPGKKRPVESVRNEEQIADGCEQGINKKTLRSSSEERTYSEAKEGIETALPMDSDSLGSGVEPENSIEMSSRLSSLDVFPSPLDPADLDSENDESLAIIHTTSNESESSMLRMNEFSHNAPSDSKNTESVRTIDDDKASTSDGVEAIPKRSLLTPSKNPLTPLNVNTLSSCKSPLTSPNLNTLSTPRKSPLTSPNLNTLSTPRKSPLTSPNLNIFIKSPKSPITSSNINVSTIPDSILYTEANSSKSGKRSGKRYMGKENFPLWESMDEEAISYHNTLSVFNSSVSSAKSRKSKENNTDEHTDSDSQHCKDETDSSKHADGVSSPEEDKIEDEELVNLAKRSVKTYARKFKGTKTKDAIDSLGHSIPDSQKTSEENDQGDDAINSDTPQHEQGHTSGTGRDLCSFHNLSGNEIGEESSSTCDTQALPQKDNFFAIDEENDLILEKSLNAIKTLTRQISEGSSSTEIYQLTESDIASAEPAIDNPFVFAPDGTGATKFEGLDDASQNRRVSTDCIASTSGVDGKTEVNTGLDLSSQTTESGNTTKLDNPTANPSGEKKGKKKKPKKRLTRLQQRIAEEGNGVRDVMKLIVVMGHRPGFEYVVSTRQDSGRETSNDADLKEE